MTTSPTATLPCFCGASSNGTTCCCDEIVGQALGQPITRREMHEAFNLVADRRNWKLPVEARVRIPNVTREREQAIIAEAVAFFTGSVARFKAIGRRSEHCQSFLVTAAGYYAAVGA